MMKHIIVVLGIVAVTVPGSTWSQLIGKPCENCLYGQSSCNASTRECRYGCIQGWLQPTCTQRCQINGCVECRLNEGGLEECTSCPPGLYGPMCNLRCNGNCLQPHNNNTCDFYGICLYGCKVPYVGENCTEQSCPFNNCLNCKVSVYSRLYCSNCKSGFYWNPQQQACLPCSSQCSPNAEACNTFSGVCDKCRDGWFGPMCNYQCNIDGCQLCGYDQHHDRSTVYCKRCKNGTYPRNRTECVSCADRNCHDQCSPTNGDCPYGCKPGYFGRENFCDRKCEIPNCLQCALQYNNNPVCVRCASGYYMYSDECKPCPTNCGGACNERSGNCDSGCTHGFYGNNCNIACSQYCTNRSCSSSGNCNCIDGWFGDKCDRSCPIHCTDCHLYTPGNCHSCEPGRYGITCDIRCSDNCMHNSYSNYIYCDKTSGECRDGCRSGFYGDQCNVPCSTQCLGNCNRTSGVCLVGCSHHYYGDKCDIQCPSNCAYAVVGYQRTCSMTDGSCQHGCQPGYYGRYCNQTCTKNCKNNLCDYNNDCVLGCSEGYTGKDCDIVCKTDCTDNCSPNCVNSVCDANNKQCTQGCTQGWWGMFCDRICDQRCEGQKCEQSTGACASSCLRGYYGLQCNLTCSVNCEEGICQKATGYCTKGCVGQRYHGDQCYTSCSSACKNYTCEQDGGKCLSCGLGKQGDFCNHDCLPGWYGENCLSQCGNCKDLSPCNTLDGNCPSTSGCEVGWTGSKCQQSFYQDKEVKTKQPYTEIAVGSGVAVLAVILTLGVVVLCWRRRKSAVAKHKTTEPVVVYREAGVNIEYPGSSQTRDPGDGGSLPQSADRVSDCSNSLLLGSDTAGLQVNLDGMFSETDQYKMYWGTMLTGHTEQDCFVRISQIDVEPERAREVWNRLMNETELQRLCCTNVNVLQLLTTYQNKNLFCVALELSAGLCLNNYLIDLSSSNKDQIRTLRDTTPTNVNKLAQINDRIGGSDQNLRSKNRARYADHNGGDKVDNDSEEYSGERIPVFSLLQFCVEISSAVEHLHLKRVLHRQIDASHVYLTDRLVAKLGDFYWAESVADDVTVADLPQENHHLLAPECLLRNQFTKQSDIWCLGLLFWEIFMFGKSPFEGEGASQHRQKVLDGTRPAKPTHAPQTLYRLMKNCWRYSIEDRPEVAQVLQRLLDIQCQYPTSQNVVIHV